MFHAALTSAQAAKPQETQANRSLVDRFAAVVHPQQEHCCEVYCAGTTVRRPQAWLILYASCRRVSPGATSSSDRFKPAFCATMEPGSSIVQRADAVTEDLKVRP